MLIISRDKALDLLSKMLQPNNNALQKADIHTWARNARISVEAIFGKNSEYVNGIVPFVDKISNSFFLSSMILHVESIKTLLNSYLFEIQELWLDERDINTDNDSIEHLPDSDSNASIVNGNDIFLVHGHDHGRMQMVARFLEHLGLNPVILHERPSAGATIIEKLEKHSKVVAAVVLLTPDDVGSLATDKENLRYRSRQNVVLELGYFLGKLGRQRTCALLVEGVEIPSDYSGVLYIQVDNGGTWKYQLAKELKEAGLVIDLNKII